MVGKRERYLVKEAMVFALLHFPGHMVYPSGVQLVIKKLKYYRDIKINSSDQ
jgi:hypothetical protein